MQFGQGRNDADPDTGVVNLDQTIAEFRTQDADIGFRPHMPVAEFSVAE